MIGMTGYSTYLLGVLCCMHWEVTQKDDDKKPKLPTQFLVGSFLATGRRFEDLGVDPRKTPR